MPMLALQLLLLPLPSVPRAPRRRGEELVEALVGETEGQSEVDVDEMLEESEVGEESELDEWLEKLNPAEGRLRLSMGAYEDLREENESEQLESAELLDSIDKRWLGTEQDEEETEDGEEAEIDEES